MKQSDVIFWGTFVFVGFLNVKLKFDIVTILSLVYLLIKIQSPFSAEVIIF